MDNLLKLLQESSAFYGSNAPFIENLYKQFLDNPESVPDSWRERFNALNNGTNHEIVHTQDYATASIAKQSSVDKLIHRYRTHGHCIAKNNPLKKANKIHADIQLSTYGLTELDMNTVFTTESLYGNKKLTLRSILSILKKIYCGNIGSEYMHSFDEEAIEWIKHRLESTQLNSTTYTAEKKLSILKSLTAAEGIEKHLHLKYVGQKRFSLEGSECLIPLLDELIQNAGTQNAKEIVIGMAHRGRLNVLINVIGKSPTQLFDEFEGIYTSLPGVITGDVKYHMGFSSNIVTPGGPVHLTLGFNPSHLEIINPVIEGSVKARQDRRGKDSVNTIIPVLIHGDAAFSGQGIVMETLNMSETRAFSTGGTIHIVINNQIGFTTSNSLDARSTRYCTDIAMMLRVPIFHVNGDNIEAVIFVTQLALDYRMKFNRDVVIDLICYRRLGHNEADEPMTTQPMMYKTINSLLPVQKIYANQLIKEEIVSAQTVQNMEQNYLHLLEQGKAIYRQILSDSTYCFFGKWNKYINQKWTVACDTKVSLETLSFCGDKLQQLPDGFELHPRVAKVLQNRKKMSDGTLPLDWGYAENLAYATLLVEGYGFRLIGQDVSRGTFSHRHIVVHNQLDGTSYCPIQHMSDNQGQAQIFDSLLSEAGVLGFEFGYSSTEPEKLNVWEAQFGDFANGAQIVIDQFISSAEAKWGRLCGLVLLLPHGFEGQGPEHSSARLERYLQLCAEHNIQVCNPTTPAQIFHLLRRQQLRPYRKPLIVMSPKSLLRHKLAVSTLEDLTEGEFFPIIGEQDKINLKHITRLIMCSGKVYYDLLIARRLDKLEHVVIVRIEQLYPFPGNLFNAEINKYPNLKQVIWCQEEPKNQGAWYQYKHHFYNNIKPNITILYAGRTPSAAPAVGSYSTHIKQQQEVVKSALYGNSHAY